MTAIPPRTFRPPPDVYAAAKVIAAQRGETLTDILNAALVRYVKRNRSR